MGEPVRAVVAATTHRPRRVGSRPLPEREGGDSRAAGVGGHGSVATRSSPGTTYGRLIDRTADGKGST